MHRYLASACPLLYPYLYPDPHLSWAQELCIYMFVWMAKFGAAYGVRTGIHVGVDVLVNQLKSAAGARSSSCSACSAARCSPPSIGTMGAKFVIGLYVHRPGVARSRDAELDRVYSCIPLGSYLMCFRFLQVGLRILEDRRTAAS